MKQKHKVPLKVRLYRMKNTGFLTFTDLIIGILKPPKICKEKPGEILFNRNDKIGDALVTIPVLRDLKLNYPSLTIDVLCSETNSFVFKGLDFINRLHIYNESNPGETEERLKAEKYNAIVDLVGTDRKLIRRLKRCAPFIAGARLFGYSWIYNYYLNTNWVSEYDTVPMSMKIEFLLKDCFGFRFRKRSNVQPYKNYDTSTHEKEFDLLVHLGTGEIRKLNELAEEKLIELAGRFKVLITDGYESERFRNYRNKYSDNANMTFRLYKTLEEIYPDALKSRLVLCYDGGQAHFLGQFARCITLVGSISLKQWAPYDFSEYALYKKWPNGVESFISQGEKKHIAVSFPVWCNPCFNVGCNTRPCINNITPDEILELIDGCLNVNN
jgi:ADP-heptose:LPS heptosyltransferase